MIKTQKKLQKKRTRKVLSRKQNARGTILKPRISVFKSNKYFYAQAIDDENMKTIVSTKSDVNSKMDDILMLGEEFGKILQSKKITEGVYDRRRFKYQGKVASFAEGLRKSKFNI